MIHFKLTFVWSKKSDKLCSFYSDTHLLLHYLLKWSSFLHGITLAPLSEMYGSISGSSGLSHWSICLSVHKYHTVMITVVLQWILQSGSESPPTLALHFQNYFVYSRSFAFPFKFQNQLINVLKKKKSLLWFWTHTEFIKELPS